MSLKGIVSVIVHILMSQTVLARSFVYLPENDGNPCMRLDVTFTMAITAYNDVFEVSTSRTETDVQNILGRCIDSTLGLTFDEETRWILGFHQNSDGLEQLDSSLQFVPSSLFQNNVSGSDILSLKDEIPIELYSTAQSYECDQLGLFQYTKIPTSPGKPSYIAEVNVSSFSFQAFYLKNGRSSPSVWCLQDNTTTTTSSTNTTTSSTLGSTSIITNTSSSTGTVSQSTGTSTFNITTIIPTTSPRPSLNNYTVEGNNVTCILLQAAFTLDINYKTNSSQESTNTVSVSIPTDATSTGNCDQALDSQSLVISFFDDWSLEFIFTLEEEPTLLSATSDASYGITNITLVYVVDPELFPESAFPQNTKVTVFPHDSIHADFPRKASSKASYQCDSNLEVKLGDGVTLQTSQLRFTAFNTNENITFAGNAENCLADESTSHTIPIVAGCSLAGLGVVVTGVYAFFKCRNQKKRSYTGI